MIKYVCFISFLFVFFSSVGQVGQTIRGSVTNEFGNSPVSNASVLLLNTNPRRVVITDSLGNYALPHIPVGRYDLEITSIGYEPLIVKEIVVHTGKETIVDVQLKSQSQQLQEVIVRPGVNKAKPLNNMATVSARMLSVEEAKRFAGGYDDPARLATAFAGVAGNTGQNGIIVRGNAPKFLQWKMEGVEIPNPSHFGDLQSFGGGLLTGLSSQMLANSDFFTAAFPAEYNNALSGIFDISLRNGNNKKSEKTFQAGIIGLDASLEGPFDKRQKSTYLFNYRYSTLALLEPLLPEDAESIKYQDISFKLHFPTQKSGTFSLWGIGLIDGANSQAKTDSTQWKFAEDNETNVIKQYMGAVGITHKFTFNKTAYVKTTLATTVNGTNWTSRKLNTQLALKPFSKISVANSNFVLSSSINKKFGRSHLHKSGFVVTGLQYNLLLNKIITPNSDPTLITDTKGLSTLISAYSSSSLKLSESLSMNIGVNGQLFTLNGRSVIEPRLGFRYQMNDDQSLALAYGLHSRLEVLNYYFNQSLVSGEKMVNKNLDFTKAHHWVASYDRRITDNLHLKVEAYYQSLYSVPVIKDSSFSLLNLQGEWFFAEKLVNSGKGKNYGLDITIERYVSKGFYFLATASVYQSRYKAGDGIWRNTRFNRKFLSNFLIGKEWLLGKNKQNVLSSNFRIAYQGGNHYSPINEIRSKETKTVVFDELNAFSLQDNPMLNLHLTISYRINKNKFSQEFALKILNLSRQPDFNGFQYNFKTNLVEKDLERIAIPNISYKIEF